MGASQKVKHTTPCKLAILLAIPKAEQMLYKTKQSIGVPEEPFLL